MPLATTMSPIISNSIFRSIRWAVSEDISVFCRVGSVSEKDGSSPNVMSLNIGVSDMLSFCPPSKSMFKSKSDGIGKSPSVSSLLSVLFVVAMLDEMRVAISWMASLLKRARRNDARNSNGISREFSVGAASDSVGASGAGAGVVGVARDKKAGNFIFGFGIVISAFLVRMIMAVLAT